MPNSHFKELLLKEQETLIEAMSTIGQLGNITDGDWVTHTDEDEVKDLEESALAEKFEEETTNEGVLDTLEERLKEVIDALERIETNVYGKCISCDKQIEKEKLEANPATLDCVSCNK
jgi:RNA polymerase-binding transcription factor DksA